MSENPWLYGEVVDGKVMLEDLKLYNALVSELDNHRIQIRIEKLQHNQSDKQRNTYFGIIIGKYLMNHSDFAGWTKVEIDEFLRHLFLRETYSVRLRVSGKYITKERVHSISKLSRAQFARFIQDVLNWALNELNLEIHIDDTKD